jgi:hypothetical protein
MSSTLCSVCYLNPIDKSYNKSDCDVCGKPITFCGLKCWWSTDDSYLCDCKYSRFEEISGSDCRKEVLALLDEKCECTNKKMHCHTCLYKINPVPMHISHSDLVDEEVLKAHGITEDILKDTVRKIRLKKKNIAPRGSVIATFRVKIPVGGDVDIKFE